MRLITSHSHVAAGAVAALLAAALIAPASVAAPGSQTSSARGAALLDAIRGGSKQCADLSRGDFAGIGEYTMGRMIGSARGHEAMDRLMSTMMGASGDRGMHEAMGRRFAGCGGAGLPAGFTRMMGAVNGMGMMGAGMMGGANQGGRFYGGPGSMMGGYATGGHTRSDDSGPSAAAMLGVMAVLIGAVAVALVWLRPRSRPAGPLVRLQQRFARGELTADEYQDRKRMLERS